MPEAPAPAGFAGSFLTIARIPKAFSNEHQPCRREHVAGGDAGPLFCKEVRGFVQGKSSGMSAEALFLQGKSFSVEADARSLHGNPLDVQAEELFLQEKSSSMHAGGHFVEEKSSGTHAETLFIEG